MRTHREPERSTPTKLLIFDRDGVLTYFEFAPLRALLDGLGWTLEFVRERWERWYRAAPLPRTLDGERAFIAEFWSELCRERGVSGSGRDAVVDFDYPSLVRPFDDARPALIEAKRRGFLVAVLSNFPLVRLEASLEAAGLGPWIDRAFAAPVIGFSKPDAAAYLHVASAFGVAPSQCAMVDDERDCALGAAEVGMRATLLDRRGASIDPDPRLAIVAELSAFVRETGASKPGEHTQPA
jgi:putative hydrolase of the HAD superfamily